MTDLRSFILRLSRNERQILSTIFRQGPIARAELAEAMGLTPGPITRLTQQFIDVGLVNETVLHTGERGPPLRPLEASSSAAYAIGVNFSHRHMDIGVIDLSGTLVGNIRLDIERPASEEVSENTKIAASRLINDLEIDRSRILGLCFAAPGVIRPDGRGIYPHPYFNELRDVDIIEALGRDLPFEVTFENDCRCYALGERVLGIGRKFDDFFCAYLGHGVGGAIVLDGALRRGAYGNAGGLHAFFPLSRQRPSGQDLFESLAREGVAVRDFNDLEREDALDLPGVRPWMARAAAQLCEALTITSRLLDPRAIVVTGRLPPPFLQEITRLIDEPMFCADSPGPKPELVPSTLGPRAGVVGAAATVFHNLIFDQTGFNQRNNILNGKAPSTFRRGGQGGV